RSHVLSLLKSASCESNLPSRKTITPAAHHRLNQTDEGHEQTPAHKSPPES
ncbi:hypothetical protein BaRGS_00024893, partial [Batillaria attramentaria]